VVRAVDAAAKRLAQRVNVPGFRRGKAPRALIERTIGKESLLEEALDQLLPEVYREALKESQVRALTQPEFDVESTEPLKAKATVVVPPPVEVGEYRAIKREVPATEVDPEEVQKSLEQLRERYADWVPAERAAELGDRVIMQVVGRSGEETVVQDQEVDFLLEADLPIPVPGFSEAVVGISAGDERDFELTVPEDNEHEELRGKTIAFHVAAKEVRGKELPELDDYFATLVGDHENIEALRKQLEDQLKDAAEKASKETAQKEVLDEAVLQATIELPEKLLEYETLRAKDRFARNISGYGLSFEQYNRLLGRTEEEASASLRTQVETDLKREFVLQAIASREGLEISDSDIDEKITEVVTADGGDSKAVARMLGEPTVRDGIRSSLLEERAARWLIKNATGLDLEAAAESEGDQ
jgi:trigger factor